MAVLKLSGVSKTIKNRTLVDNLSFEVNPGEIVGFLGPNGAGKTTTVKLIMGLFSITTGKIEICGINVQTDFEKAMEQVGAIIENPELYAHLSGRDNLQFFANMYPDIKEERINGLVKQVKLEERIDDLVKTYSLGMRQRLGVAQALLHQPKLLILDEPNNGLDPLGIKELRNTLKNLAKEGTAILISSHLLSEIELLCDRIIVIDNGRMVESLDMGLVTETSFQDAFFTYTVETSDNEKALALLSSYDPEATLTKTALQLTLSLTVASEAVKVLIENDLQVFSFARNQKTLEDKYIDLTQSTDGQIL